MFEALFLMSWLDDFWGVLVHQGIYNSGEPGFSIVVVGEFYERTASHQLDHAWIVWHNWIPSHVLLLYGL